MATTVVRTPSRTNSPPLLMIWSLLTLLLAGTASCGSIAAWWVNDKGPALVMQDDESGGIRYSLCNTNSTPIFPNDTTLVAPLDDYPPKMNTSLAGAGWWNGTDYFVSVDRTQLPPHPTLARLGILECN